MKRITAIIAIVLELSGVSALAFAVGVYLPISSSAPIYVGGMVRWLVDQYTRRKHAAANLSEDQLVAETDKSPGVLMASGYIAGGALAAIVIAILQGVPRPALAAFNKRVEDWATLHNPMFHGSNSDMLSMIPFLILMVLLYLVGREVLLTSKPTTVSRR